MAQLNDLLVLGKTSLIGDVNLSSNFTIKDITIDGIINNTSAGNCNWSSNGQAAKLITLNTLAYWNGAYNSSNSSNLAYCSKGAFGTIVTKNYTDSSSASAISTGTNIPTERDIYYGLPTINNSHAYTSNTAIYAPTSGGTANYVLIGQGATLTPTWTAQSNLNVGYTSKINLNGISDDTKYGTYGGIIQSSSGGPNASNWHNSIKILHNNSEGYYTQLAQQFTGAHGLWHRSCRAGVISDWYNVLDSNNYTNYTVKKDGTGASGTWGISITGTATKLATARTIRTNLASTSTASFDGSANITPGVTGTLAISNGGTGKTTAVDACNTFLNALTTGSSAPSDNDYFISQYAGGGTTNTTYHRRPVSALWSYMKSKADGVYAPKAHASTATTYGVGNTTTYGHLKQHAAEDCTTFTSDDGAITPAAAKKLINAFYTTCSTAAATAAKTVSCQSFSLVTGAKITIKFTVTNTAENPTLNVNSTGAKPIFYRGSAISKGYLAANRTYTFVYNGTQYELIGDINTNTTNSTGTTNKAGTKLFLAGATSQASSPTTYSNSGVYIGTDNCLYSNSKKVATSEELDKVKTSVSEGKALIAAAVTGKGVNTAATDTFQTMANNINSISTTLSFENLTLVGSSEDNASHPYDGSTSNDSISITIPDNDTYLVVIQTGFHNSSRTAYTNAGSWCGLYIISNKTIISKWDGTVYHHTGSGSSHTWCGVKNNTVTPTLTNGVLTVTIWYEDISWSVFDSVEETMGYFLYKI